MKSTAFKKTLSVLTLGLMGLTAGAAQAGWGYDNDFKHGPGFQQGHLFNQKIDQRQEHQMQRIQAGYRNGQLTPREYRELMHEQQEIRAMERQFRANDGRIGPREFERLDQALDVADRNIKHEKHDRQARYGYDHRPWYN